MSVASIFEFRFSSDAAKEGLSVARSIGADMRTTDGYIGHDVVQDIADPGHVIVMTRWSQQSEGEATLGRYMHDPKVARASELMGDAPSGFLGTVQTAEA